MSLFDECIETLHGDASLLTDQNKDKVLKALESYFPFTEWGRIDWEKVHCHAEVTTTEEIVSFLDEHTSQHNYAIYIIWNEEALPILQSDLEQVLKSIDDVIAVSFDTWLFSPSSGFVIEIFHDGIVRVGINNPN
ncbi:CDI toxin immunity protein [Sporolactobacillus terrae]|uniref:CDI toxin immunity protein n=1 Tax=Sporolactobacillus terrae TaxID=269673 RepID=UPI001117F114|nr:hypothetical protein [Sporolactobacillus terrae]